MEKIVRIINAMEIGGVEVGVISLLKYKNNKNYEVITVKGCDNDLYQSLTESEQSRLHVCNGYCRALLLLLKLKPRVVISSLWRAHLVSFIFKILKPNIIRVHFEHSSGFAHLVDSIITRISILMANFIFCDSSKSQDWLINNVDSFKTSIVVPMNISFSSIAKEARFDPVNFVFVGRFSKEKNLFKAIDFIKSLNDYGILATLDLYGRDDGLLEELSCYVNNNGLSDIIQFHSSMLPTLIETEMRKYNYYLQTSIYEGMAISVYQSIKNGLLPVVTPVGEIPKYTKNGINAFYLDVNDLNASARSFEMLISSGEINNFEVGYMINKNDYREFGVVFVEAVYNILNR